MGLSWSNALALVGVASFLIIMKILICSCLRRRQSRAEDTLPILDETIERLHEIHQTRLRARRAREPPPSFEEALRNSRPVSYIDIEEPPPPTYDEYIKSTSNSYNENSLLDNPFSINPSDIVISLDECRNNDRNLSRVESNA